EAAEGAVDQQARPRHARSRPGVRPLLAYGEAAHARPRPGDPGPAGNPIDVYLQAAAFRRRGQLARRFDLSLYQPAELYWFLVRARGCDHGEWRDVVPSGRASHAAEIALPAQGRQADHRNTGPDALAGWPARRAGGAQGIADRPARPAAPLQWA